MQNTKVSYYKNVQDTVGQLVTLAKILEGIKTGNNGRWLLAVEKLRNTQDESEQKECKSSLPCFTTSGLFTRRSAEGLVVHSGFILLDVDSKDNPALSEQGDRIRQRLTDDKHTAFLFTSCRGKGLAVGVRIDGSRHAESFRCLEAYYKKTYGLVVDKGCKDVSRLRFVSYDPNLYTNENSTIFTATESELQQELPSPPCASEDDHRIMQKIISSGRPLTGIDDYDSWLNMGFAVANTFGEVGREYFHALSKASPKYDQVDCDRKYDNCLQTNKGAFTFATIVHRAKESGIDLRDDSVTVVTEVTVAPEEIIPIYEFPIGVFPSKFKSFVLNLSGVMNVSGDVVGTASLAVLSASIGNALRVSTKADYTVSPFLWAGIVLPSGAGKSPLMNFLMFPVYKKQSSASERHKTAMREYEAELQRFKRRGKDDIGYAPEMPKMEQHYVSDCTIESLADVFEVQPRGVLSYQDELASMILGMNQYKGAGNDRQHYLSLWNSQALKVDRKSGSRFIPNTGLSVIGGVQPKVFAQVFGEESFDDGFITRFLFVAPDLQPLRFNRESLSLEDRCYWEDLIIHGYDADIKLDSCGFVEPRIITLDDEALDLWEAFYCEYGTLFLSLPEKARVFIPKLYLYSLKLAGLLHTLNHFGIGHIPHKINAETIRGAIELTRYYFGQVGKVLNLYTGKDESTKQRNRIINALWRLQGEVVNGKLKLSRIVEEYNNGLPECGRLTSEGMSSVLNRRLGLTTKKSTGNISYLSWEGEKIENLFKTTVTTVTTVTTPDKKQGERVVDGVTVGAVGAVVFEKDIFSVPKGVEKLNTESKEIPEIEFAEEVEANV